MNKFKFIFLLAVMAASTASCACAAEPSAVTVTGTLAGPLQTGTIPAGAYEWSIVCTSGSVQFLGQGPMPAGWSSNGIYRLWTPLVWHTYAGSYAWIQWELYGPK